MMVSGEETMEHYLIALLRERGYIVRHHTEANRSLTWNRAAPPPHFDFKQEALKRLREGIQLEHIDFSIIPGEAPTPENPIGYPDVHRATLRII